MKTETLPLEGLLLITPARFGDERGFFSETWNKKKFSKAGITTEFVQDNHSFSARTGTIRGLHFQAPPSAQAKLVRCGRGVLFDVAVDIRQGSATYGHWFGVELSFENGRQLLIPEGFAHGFVTRVDDTEIIYKCSETYAPKSEGALAWNDPDIAIDWGLEGRVPILSGKDASAGFLADFDSPFTYEATP